MARKLSEKDQEILKKCAPECVELFCSESGAPYRSVLPPLANHYATDADDFRERISRLTPDELKYLTGLILSGEESLCCLSPVYFASFLDQITKHLGRSARREMLNAYRSSEDCFI
ncbi:hypothetical protein [Methanogenium organophilum]|uniref:Uncharacterized protein n=1 Tax=Methanogenium organophilum TaxID=2199 RepID=A0A9X9S1X8_METOG|nr:hypothetical protein [Methanogenium organophilum]WAI00256.1 hypothetical protein OU421_07385 [Methanogenium organophilum]